MESFVKFALFMYLGTSLIMAVVPPGGVSEVEHEADNETQEMVAVLASQIKPAALELFDAAKRPQVEEELKTANIIALAYRSQVVAGMNYFVKVKLANYIFHVRIYRDLKLMPNLVKVVGPKTESDLIEYAF